MRRILAIFALVFCCTQDPTTGGSGGAPGATSSMSGVGGSDAGAAGAAGTGGKPASDGAGGFGGWIEDAGEPDSGCGSPPTGGVGICDPADPPLHCPLLTPEQEACWSWACDCTAMLCYCVAEPAQ